MRKLKIILCLMLAVSGTVQAQQLETRLSLKQPGNKAMDYKLRQQGTQLVADRQLPVQITLTETKDGDDRLVSVNLKATARVYFHFSLAAPTGYSSASSDFNLPGFWYHKNLRSPQGAPSFRESKSWTVREDRLSTPLTSVYDPDRKSGLVVLRNVDTPQETVMQYLSGDIILPGNTSLGYLGFDGSDQNVKLCFGFPYEETPKRYIRKLTLIDPIRTYMKLEAGEERTVSWRIHEVKAEDFGQFVASTWQYSFDTMRPSPLTPRFTPDEVKAQLANYFRHSYVDRYPLKYNSGISLRIDDCKPVAEVQLGFCGRPLLNAFNELEYGEQTGAQDLVGMGNAIFDSWLQNGFSPNGWFVDAINFANTKLENLNYVHSIRQQSEGVYATLLYLKYEKQQGRKHKEWEKRLRTLLNNLVALQKEDGHFARKYDDNGKDIDASGGSTPLGNIGSGDGL